jgi:signal transduction histidine kinase
MKWVAPLLTTAFGWLLALSFFATFGAWHGPGVWLLPLAALLLVLAVLLVRRRPVAALLLTLVWTLATTLMMGAWPTWYLGVIVNDAALGWVAVIRRRRAAVAGAALTLLCQAAATQTAAANRDAFPRTVVVLLLAVVTAVVLGWSVRDRRQHAEAIRARAAADAVTAERLRIAREVHDVLAHSVGVIAIQAGVGRRVMATRPEEARAALAAIEATSREALAGLRRTVGSLRRDDPSGLAYEPAPGLADLPRLADSAARAGVRVAVEWRGERRPLPPDVDLAAYRIVQESVTNVVRHAGTDRCRVEIAFDEDAGEVAVTVEDAGRGAVGTAGAGFGLAGMRERVALLGGEFTAGPVPAGGFRVAARLPLPGDGR